MQITKEIREAYDKRNKEIHKDWMKGLTYKELCPKYSLNRMQIFRIVKSFRFKNV